MRPTYDIIIIGASFAGLACARQAARRGLSVVVLDRKTAPGERVHTTGILVKEAWAEWRVPKELVRKIRRVRVYAPSHRYVEMERRRYYFLATDTPRLMDHLVRETRSAGAEVRFGETYRGLARGDGGAPALLGFGISGRFLVGADGARSPVARSVGLSRNDRLLKGTEWEFAATTGVEDCLHCFIDPECAPGYLGWVVPGVGVTQVGLAAHRHRTADMTGFVAKIEDRFGLSGRSVLGKRGGVIPIGGLLRDFYRERVLLIGDAAGMVSPLTAGGIHAAYRCGRLAADAIKDFFDGGPHPGDVVRRAYDARRWKHVARWGFDHLPVAAALDAGALARRVFRGVAGRVFFDQGVV